MAKKLLTDLAVKNARVKRGSKDLMLWDMQTRGLCLVVRPSGTKLFKLITAYPGKRGWCKRTLGTYPVMTLSEAREKVTEWRRLIAASVDPKDEERRRKQEAARAHRHTFENVLQRYAAEHLSKLRRGNKDRQEIEREVLPAWRHRPIASITRTDAIELIRPIARRAPATAHLTLNHVGRIFSWAINDGSYGLETSPTVTIRPQQLIGPKRSRDRVLTNAELKAFWRACDKISGAYGSFYRLVALTGVRAGEAAGAQWKEFDLDEAIWRIPAERFKSGQQHVVALSDDAVALLKSVVRFKGCEFVFTLSGTGAINGFSKAKHQLDELMHAELRKEQPDAELPNWTAHDLRRTYRTRLSELKIEERVAELAIGHGKRGLARTYDLHEFESELRAANERWAQRLHQIVTGKPAKVVALRA